MSLSSLFTVLLLWGSYSLGKFNAERPGDAWRLFQRCWTYLAAQWTESSRHEK